MDEQKQDIQETEEEKAAVEAAAPAESAEQAAEAAEAASDEQVLQVERARHKLRHAHGNLRAVHWFGLHAIVFAVVLYILFSFFVGLVNMPTADMSPRIDSGDLLLYWRLDRDHKANDVIIFDKGGSTYVGRIVAAGGDTVEITDAETVKVNGNTLVESNIYQSTPRYEGFTDYPLTLEEGTYFVLVDAREGGHDSRYFGPVSADEIKGTVVSLLRRHNL